MEQTPIRPNPLYEVWMAPRSTIRRIVQINPDYLVLPLVCLYGIELLLSRFQGAQAGTYMPILTLLGVALVAGPILGLVLMWMMAGLVRWTGQWLHGAGNVSHIRAAIAWSMLPSNCALVVWVPLLLAFGQDLFSNLEVAMRADPFLALLWSASSLLTFALFVWSFLLACHTVSEVQGFPGVWKGFLNLILAGATLVVPVLIILSILARLLPAK